MRIIDAVLGLFKPSVVTTETKIKTVRLETVDSTNSFLRTYTPAADEPMTVAVAAYQTAGRGQGRIPGRVRPARISSSQSLSTP